LDGSRLGGRNLVINEAGQPAPSSGGFGGRGGGRGGDRGGRGGRFGGGGRGGGDRGRCLFRHVILQVFIPSLLSALAYGGPFDSTTVLLNTFAGRGGRGGRGGDRGGRGGGRGNKPNLAAPGTGKKITFGDD
jgi:hypothetical protein